MSISMWGTSGGIGGIFGRRDSGVAQPQVPREVGAGGQILATYKGPGRLKVLEALERAGRIPAGTAAAAAAGATPQQLDEAVRQAANAAHQTLLANPGAQFDQNMGPLPLYPGASSIGDAAEQTADLAMHATNPAWGYANPAMGYANPAMGYVHPQQLAMYYGMPQHTGMPVPMAMHPGAFAAHPGYPLAPHPQAAMYAHDPAMQAALYAQAMAQQQAPPAQASAAVDAADLIAKGGGTAADVQLAGRLAALSSAEPNARMAVLAEAVSARSNAGRGEPIEMLLARSLADGPAADAVADIDGALAKLGLALNLPGQTAAAAEQVAKKPRAKTAAQTAKAAKAAKTAAATKVATQAELTNAVADLAKTVQQLVKAMPKV